MIHGVVTVGGATKESVVTVSAGVDGSVGWVAVYRQWYRPMAQLAGMLVGDYRAGEDLAQDAFVRLVEAGDRVLDPAAYLRGTVVNLSRAQVRRAAVARRHPSNSALTVGGPEERTDEIATRMAIRQALRRLPRRQREAIVLFYFSELSEAETAVAMGVSAGSVKRHLYRARVSLSSELEWLR